MCGKSRFESGTINPWAIGICIISVEPGRVGSRCCTCTFRHLPGSPGSRRCGRTPFLRIVKRRTPLCLYFSKLMTILISIIFEIIVLEECKRTISIFLNVLSYLVDILLESLSQLQLSRNYFPHFYNLLWIDITVQNS